MAKHEFYELEKLPTKDEMKKLVPDFSYVRISTDSLPEAIRTNGLAQKCNSFLVAASGSTGGTCYTAIGLRPDQKGTVIDEHPFVFYYDRNDASRTFGGIINQGHWPERTKPLEQWQIDLLSSCGLTVSFTYKTVPLNTSGSLDDLDRKGILTGVSTQFKILLKHAPDPSKGKS